MVNFCRAKYTLVVSIMVKGKAYKGRMVYMDYHNKLICNTFYKICKLPHDRVCARMVRVHTVHVHTAAFYRISACKVMLGKLLTYILTGDNCQVANRVSDMDHHMKAVETVAESTLALTHFWLTELPLIF